LLGTTIVPKLEIKPLDIENDASDTRNIKVGQYRFIRRHVQAVQRADFSHKLLKRSPRGVCLRIDLTRNI
jgi:GH25 family lysozyme M1 (1,4-beta-N-acetylmuramidase)